MKFRVLGAGFILSVAISISSRAGAQSPLPAAEPASPSPVASSMPAPSSGEPAPSPVEPTAPAAAPAAPPAVMRPPPPVVELPLPAPEPQENFGFGAQLGFYNPSGLAVRMGARAISVEVTAGFVPVLLSYGSSQHPDLKFLLPFEVSPQFVIHALTFKDDIRAALLLGYRYNVALGHGATLGGRIEKRVTRKLVLEGLWGFSYYPDAADRLRGDQVPPDTSFNFPPQLGGGLSVGLLYYP